MARLPTLKPRLKAVPQARIAAASGEAARVEARGSTAERGFGYVWQRASVAFRKRYPACAYCWLEDRHGPAELVDHLYPHGIRRGRDTPAQRQLFNDEAYWVSSCHHHHRGFKAQVEDEGIEAIDSLAQRLGLEPLSDKALRRVVRVAIATRA